jgi:DNA invertase Pin-like site-specific DNA recombinase
VVAYVRVSTADQHKSGIGEEAQRKAITQEAERRGWEIVRFAEDVASGKSMNGRHALHEAIADIERREADALVAARLDRVSRSALDFATLAERARRNGWALVVLDLGVDMTTPVGEMIAGVLSYLAQFERRLIADRTRAALAVKAEELAAEGKQLGRPRSLPQPVVDQIIALRRSGLTQQQIADHLNQDGIPTGHGAPRWRQTVVGRVLARQDAAYRGRPVRPDLPTCARCERIAVAKMDGERLCKPHHEAALRARAGGSPAT